MSSPAPSGSVSRAQRVAAAVGGWRSQLSRAVGSGPEDAGSEPAVLDLTRSHPSGLAQLLAGRPARLSGLVREPAALAESRRRAGEIRSAAVELQEECGIFSCYLMVGAASWTMPGTSPDDMGDGADVVPLPVLLRPCELRPRGAGQEDYDLDLGDTAVLNPLLVDRLQRTHGIALDPGSVAGLAGGERGFDPEPVFVRLRELAVGVPGFTVRARLMVANLVHVELALLRDLDELAGGWADHGVLAALIDPGSAPVPQSSAGVRDPAGDIGDRDPADELLVLDTDLWQQEVLDRVLSGESLLVHGPPGTGKTQTVANLVAALAAHGSTSLVVSGKRAALTSLGERLASVGLGDLVLDVSGGELERRGTTDEVLASLDSAGSVPVPDLEALRATLVDRRLRLRSHAESLHGQRPPWGVSAAQAQVRLVELTALEPAPQTRVRLSDDRFRELGLEQLAVAHDTLRRAAELGAFTVGPADTAWYGAEVSTAEQGRAAIALARRVFEQTMPTARARMAKVSAAAGLGGAGTVADWERQLALLIGVRATLDTFVPGVYEYPVVELVAATATRRWRHEHSIRLGWVARTRRQRRARELLRPGTRPDDLHAALLAAQEQRKAWQREANAGGWPVVPSGLADAENELGLLRDDLQALGAVLSASPEGGDLTATPLDELVRRVARLAGDTEAMDTLPGRTAALESLRAMGLGPLLEDLRLRRVPMQRVGEELDLAWWSTVLRSIAEQDLGYGNHDGDQLRTLVSEYRLADRAWLAAGVPRVRRAVAEQTLAAAATHPDQVERLRASADRPTSLSELATTCPDLLRAARPCWTVSPLLVPQVVAPETRFDVVIVDEASLLALPAVASAISRGTRLVVFGDPHQLPARGGPPLLDAAGDVLVRRDLGWHYRSGDERLASFVDSRVYAGGLRTAPGVHDAEALRLVRVHADGSTDAEVERVVRLVLWHAEHRAHESLAVLAGSRQHAVRVSEALRSELANRPDLEAYFDPGRPEPFMVRDLRRCQGDERDAVVLSIGYTAGHQDQPEHRFGVLDQEDGVQQLTVGLTRARWRTTIVTSIGAQDLDAQDLDPTRLRSPGARMLADLLNHLSRLGTPAVDPGAPGGRRPTQQPETVDALVDDLRQRLVDAGMPVLVSYGTPAQQVDLAVGDPRRPGRMLVAVQLDGTRYAAVPRIRDRERRQDEQLERLGWRVVRVWSADAFRDPEAEVARVHAAWREAMGETPGESVPSGRRRDGDPRQRHEAEPEVARGLPINAYSDDELDALVRWIGSDARPRNEDEVVAELRSYLGLSRRGVWVDRALSAAAKRAMSGPG